MTSCPSTRRRCDFKGPCAAIVPPVPCNPVVKHASGHDRSAGDPRECCLKATQRQLGARWKQGRQGEGKEGEAGGST